jgi:hypothetical protein
VIVHRAVFGFLALIVAAASPLAGAATTGGNIVITGHDDDFHAWLHQYEEQNPNSTAMRQINAIATFARNGSILPVLVMTQPGSHSPDPGAACGLASNMTSYLTCDLTTLNIPFVIYDISTGVPPASLFDVTKYSAIAVSSFYGGGDDGDIDTTGAANLLAAKASFQTFVNSGGGVFAFASSSNASFYSFLPNTAAYAGQPLDPSGFSAGPDRVSVAIPVVNGDPTHNFFTNPGTGGMDPAWKVLEIYNGLTTTETTVTNAPVTVAIQGAVICPTGFAVTPAITSISPTSVQAGNGDLAVTITGTNFTSADVVLAASGTFMASTVSSTQIVFTLPASYMTSAGSIPIQVQLPASVSCTGSPLTSNSVNLSVTAAPTISISSVSPPSIPALSGDTNITISGNNFQPGVQLAVLLGGNSATLANVTVVNATTITATVPGSALSSSSSLGTPGTATLQLTLGTTTAQTNLTIAPPASTSVPALTLGLKSQPTSPADQPTLTVSSSNPTASGNFAAVFTLSFTPSVSSANLPSAGLQDIVVKFATGNPSICVAVPVGPNSSPVSVDLSTVSGGTFMQTTIAGTITITPHIYYPGSCNTNSSGVQGTGTEVTTSSSTPYKLVIASSAPVITNTPSITGATSTGFNVELNAYSTTRDLTTASFTFTPAAGAQLNGTSFAGVPLAQAGAQWFTNSSSATTGGAFHLTVPFTFSGNPAAIGTVTVTLSNSAGTSAPSSPGSR